MAVCVSALSLFGVIPQSDQVAHAAPQHGGCSWTPLGNGLYPDLNARYWRVQVPLGSGQHISVRGRYPHARYMAYALQGPGGSGDARHDTQIEPDAGSTNPFVVGGDRNTGSRNYALRVVPGSPPTSGRAKNTLYSGQPQPGGTVTLIYRIYDVDEDVDQATGGVGFPTVEAVGASGAAVTTCAAGSPTVTPGASFAAHTPLPVTGIGAIGTTPPSWQKFVDTPTVYAQILHSNLLGDEIYRRLSAATSGGASGGLGANVDNQYITTLLNPNYGKVVEFRATMPTYPETSQGQSPMGSGQVRYWSMCSEVLETTQAVQCVADHQVPLTAARTFTIVVSAPADRPRFATAGCGVAWLPMSTAPGTVLLMRNLLAEPGFAHSIGNATLNDEQATMGSYYPRGQYFPNAAAFDRRGCQQ